jgi:Uma2 family endonuclease
MNAAVALKTRYTFADLLAMEPADELYEILGGELVVFSAPDESHAASVTGVFLFLGEAQRLGRGQVRTAPRAVAFDFAERGFQAIDVTQPDVFFVRQDRLHIMGDRCVEDAPDLVVEVLSPSTRQDDLPGGRKWAIYERYGVAYYWLVDPLARTLTQYTWRDGRFGDPLVLRPGDTVRCPLFPDVTCDVRDLLGGA